MLGALIILFSCFAFCLQHHQYSENGRWPREHLPFYASKRKEKNFPLPATPAISPPRVNRGPGSVPIRQQISWAKAYKRFVAAVPPLGIANKSTQPKRFRQGRSPKEKEEAYVEVDYVNTPPPAIFVDGYNVIGFMNVFEERTITLDEARDCLVSDLCVLKSGTGWWIELVFDAYKIRTPERSECVNGIWVTYTGPTETSDDYIERRLNEFKSKGFTNVVVATDDRMLRMSAEQLGAGFLTCAMILEELRIAYKEWEITQDDINREAKAATPTIEDSLSAEMKELISNFRENAAFQNHIDGDKQFTESPKVHEPGDNAQRRYGQSFINLSDVLKRTDLNSIKTFFDERKG